MLRTVVLVGLDDLAHEIVAHDVAVAETHVADARQFAEQRDGVAEARLLSGGEDRSAVGRR